MPRFSSQVSISGLFIIHVSCIIRITKTNHLKSAGMPICQHEILGTLKIPQNFLSHFLVASIRITHVTPQKDPRIFIIILLYILGMN